MTPKSVMNKVEIVFFQTKGQPQKERTIHKNTYAPLRLQKGVLCYILIRRIYVFQQVCAS